MGGAGDPCPSGLGSHPCFSPDAWAPGQLRGWGPRPRTGRKGTRQPLIPSWKGRAQILDFQFLEEGEGWGSGSLLVLFEGRRRQGLKETS